MGFLKTRSLRIVVLLWMSLLAAPFAHSAFTKASLKGSYGFLLNRWTADLNKNQEGDLGVVTFNGAGKVATSFTSVSGGVASTTTLSGTYTMKATGIGAATFTTTGGPVKFVLALSSTVGGVAEVVQLMITNDATNGVTRGIAVLQSPTAVTYTNATLKGIFVFRGDSWTADSSQDRTGTVGLLTFSGAGKVKGTFSLVKKGVLQAGTATGTYIVNADGTVTMSLKTGTDTPQFVMVLNTVVAGHATGFDFLQTNETSNRVDSGTGLMQ
jgi:hypothetical protein